MVRILAVPGDAHLDKTVAGVVEIASADRDIVVEPRRRGRVDRVKPGRQCFVVEFVRRRPAVILPDLFAPGLPIGFEFVGGRLVRNARRRRRIGISDPDPFVPAVDRAFNVVDAEDKSAVGAAVRALDRLPAFRSRPVNQPAGRGEAQTNFWVLGVGLDEAHLTKIDGIGLGRLEIGAISMQGVDIVIGDDHLAFCRDNVDFRRRFGGPPCDWRR